MRPALSAVLLISATIGGSAAAQDGGRDAPGPVSVIPDRPSLDTTLDEITSRPEYRAAMEGSGESFDLLGWVRRTWAKLGTLQDAGTAAFWGTVIAGCEVLVILLAHITYTVVKALRPRAKAPAGRQAAKADPVRSPEDLIAEADRLAGRGEFRGAIRSLYLALVRDLQMRGRLPRTRAQTNWEHVRHLSADQAVVAHVRPFARTFDEKWYGGRPAGAEDVAQCRQWLEAALREVEGP